MLLCHWNYGNTLATNVDNFKLQSTHFAILNVTVPAWHCNDKPFIKLLIQKLGKPASKEIFKLNRGMEKYNSMLIEASITFHKIVPYPPATTDNVLHYLLH